MSNATSSRPKIVIIGCGFGGLEAAKALRSAAVEITLIDRTNHHLFQPLLYQVATAGLSAPSIAAPARFLFRRQRNVTTLLGDVVDIDVAQRAVVLENGERVSYDHLISPLAQRTAISATISGPRMHRASRRWKTRSRFVVVCCSRSNMRSGTPIRLRLKRTLPRASPGPPSP